MPLRHFEPTCPFGYGISNPVINNKRNKSQIICYARKYGSILETGDASSLTSLTGPQRRHAMEALTVLSKQIGCYDRWQQIRKSYSLHWTNGNESVQALQRFFDSNLTLDSMVSKVEEMIRGIPRIYGEVVRFACLTGLRPSEACESVSFIVDPTVKHYYNPQQQCLEHFRFPSVFLRPTKKTFISYLSRDNYHAIASLGCKNPPTWNVIRSACKRRKINMNMRLCRKVFASWLIQSGIDSTTVDMLQGRCPPNILARHYQSPDSSLCNRVLDAVNALMKEIDR